MATLEMQPPPRSTLNPAAEPVADLRALAWINDDIQRIWEGALKGLRRAQREIASAQGVPGEATLAVLVQARAALHQATGALAMVGLDAAARHQRSCELLVQRWLQEPERLTPPSLQALEHAGFALQDFLRRRLADRPVSSLALFASTQAVTRAAGLPASHPAEWAEGLPPLTQAPNSRWPSRAQPLAAGASSRQAMEQALLAGLRGDEVALGNMAVLCERLGAGTPDARMAEVWHLAAALFQAQVAGVWKPDEYGRRIGSRLLAVLRGSPTDIDALRRDLRFFAATVPRDQRAPVVAFAQIRLQLPHLDAAEYQNSPLGRVDPALLPQAKRRVATLRETWSALAGGEAAMAALVPEQATQLAQLLRQVMPASPALPDALEAALHAPHVTQGVPSPEAALEIATALLCVEACIDVGDDGSAAQERLTRLSTRLTRLAQGKPPGPVEPWMEQLYRQASDQQTMGNVVQELRTSLAQVEQLLDKAHRDPQAREGLIAAPGILGDMRGVLSVLGLSSGAQALMRLRDDVDQWVLGDLPPDVDARITHNLSALSFLVDMLAVQPQLTKSLFVFDAPSATLQPVMGRAGAAQAAPAPSAPVADQQALQAVPTPTPEPVQGLTQRFEQPAVEPPAPAAVTTAPVAPTPPPVADDDGLVDVFLEEAREVLGDARSALDALNAAPDDAAAFTTLRRAWHTLKGSARMVGLNDIGEAAWAGEQLFNKHLATDPVHAPAGLRAFAARGHAAIAAAVEAVARGEPQGIQAAAIAQDADTCLSATAAELPLQAPADGQAEQGPGAPQHLDLAPASALVVESAHDAVMDIDLDIDPLVSSTTPAPLEAGDPADNEATIDIAVPMDEAPHVMQEASAPPVDFSLDLDLDLQSLAAPPASPPQDSTSEAPPSWQATETALPLDMAADETPDAFELDLVIGQSQAQAPELPDELAPSAPVEAQALDPSWPELEPQATLQPEPPSLDDAHGVALATLPEALVPDSAGHEHPALHPAPLAEDVKTIGSVEVPLAAFNAFLLDADEHSRLLCSELAEWAMTPEALANPSASCHARAALLRDQSARLGLHPLAEVASWLAGALPRAGHVAGLVSVAEDLRRMLHQFAAGLWQDVPAALAEHMRAWDAATTADPASVTPADTSHQAGGLVPMPPAAPDEAEASDGVTTQPANTALPQDGRAGTAEAPDQTPRDVSPSGFPAAVQAALAELDAPLTAPDVPDASLWGVFREEAAELLDELAQSLHAWQSEPHEAAPPQAAMRLLHTLKGSARLAGAAGVGEQVHRLESLVERCAPLPQLDPAIWRRIESAADAISEALAGLDEAASLPPEAPVLVPELSDAADLVQEPVQVESESAVVEWPAAADAAPGEPESLASPLAALGLAQDVPAEVALDAPAHTASAPWGRHAAEAAGLRIRVPAQLLDRLVAEAAEAGLARARLDGEVARFRESAGELALSLARLRSQLRELEMQAESQMASRVEASRPTQEGFDPLELDRFTRVQELSRMLAESVADLAALQRGMGQAVQNSEDQLAQQARHLRTLQDELLAARLVSFATLSERLMRVVRRAGRELGKPSFLSLDGSTLEIDRGVLERITPVLEHVLRNAVVHGIEPPAVRRKAGKPADGHVTLSIRQQGSSVQFCVEDDGAGLNLQAVKAQAQARGLIGPDDAPSEAELTQLIFQPGFSTAADVSELAGRGVGLDVVRTEVSALGGQLAIDSRSGEGTRLTLTLPLTSVVSQVVVVGSGAFTLGLPATAIESVEQPPANAIERAVRAGVWRVGDAELPCFSLGPWLGQGDAVDASEPGALVVVHAGEQRVVLHVAVMRGHEEAVLRRVGPQLAAVSDLSGVAQRSTGEPLLIYNPLRLIEAVRLAGMAQASAPQSAQAPLVLVVDDSLTVRRVTDRLLQRLGYRVASARDGQEALDMLQTQVPAMVLSDIEMPQLDGFGLLQAMRQDPRLSAIPCVMITSRIADRHREHAMALGAVDYLGKPYDEERLTELLAQYAGATKAGAH